MRSKRRHTSVVLPGAEIGALRRKRQRNRSWVIESLQNGTSCRIYYADVNAIAPGEEDAVAAEADHFTRGGALTDVRKGAYARGHWACEDGVWQRRARGAQVHRPIDA